MQEVVIKPMLMGEFVRRKKEVAPPFNLSEVEALSEWHKCGPVMKPLPRRHRPDTPQHPFGKLLRNDLPKNTRLGFASDVKAYEDGVEACRPGKLLGRNGVLWTAHQEQGVEVHVGHERDAGDRGEESSPDGGCD